MMLVEFRRWIRRHANVVMSFVIGLTFGASVVALAHFSARSGVASRVLLYGVHATGHTDLDEDLIWFLGGLAVGEGQAAYLEDQELLPPTFRAHIDGNSPANPGSGEGNSLRASGFSFRICACAGPNG